MQKHDLIKNGESIYRVLAFDEEYVLLINCQKRTMPKWYDLNEMESYELVSEEDLQIALDTPLFSSDEVSPKEQAISHQRFTIIAPIIAFVGDDRMRSRMINQAAQDNGLCTQTVRNYLCSYLIFQSLSALLPQERGTYKKPLTDDEKNFRYAINKYYFTRHKNSLKTAYTYMLRDKYCDENGVLLEVIPSWNQFRYFYTKYRKKQTEIISRNGLKAYQRDYRPLLGEGLQEFAPYVGVGQIDSTICDIYLVDSNANVVGRPNLTILTDSFSSGYVYGYSLTWEGGMYALRDLFLNVVTPKDKLCKSFGISMNSEQWDSTMLPSVIVTDMGAEYQSDTLSQITSLGVQVLTLPALRPELKSIVERSFQLIQESIKPALMDHGYVDKDFGERLAFDYRKNARLTIHDYEKIIIRAILYHNSQRVIENYPYTREMLDDKVKPYSNCIFEWGKNQSSCNLIQVDADLLMLTLLPRAKGRFTRRGLVVLGLRYSTKEKNYTEAYLNGKDNVTVAYNPDSANTIYLLEDTGEFVEFGLIESRFSNKTFDEIAAMQKEQKELVQDAVKDNLQGRIDLTNHIEAIVGGTSKSDDIQLKNVRNSRNKAKKERHKDFIVEVKKNE